MFIIQYWFDSLIILKLDSKERIFRIIQEIISASNNIDKMLFKNKWIVAKTCQIHNTHKTAPHNVSNIQNDSVQLYNCTETA